MYKYLLIPVILYLSLACYQINLPGLHYDEAVEVVPAVQLLKNQPVHTFREVGLPLFGTKWPLTTQDYIGALNTYGTLPFLIIGGINVISLRSYAILIGLLSLLLAYRFTTDFTRRPVAGLLASTLLAVNPTFIFWNRQGVFVTAVTATIGLAAAWMWLKWWRTKQYRYAWWGAFLFGLGLYAKLLFVWLIGPFALVFSWVQWRQLAHPEKSFPQQINHFIKASSTHVKLSGWVGLLLAGLCGLWPLLVYNFLTGGTLENVGQNSLNSYYGVDNTAVFTNLGTRLEQLVTLLNSGHFWYLGQVEHNYLWPIIFGLALSAAIWLAYAQNSLKSLIPFIIIGGVVLQSIITISALWITHFALMMVWPTIAVSTVAATLWTRFNQKQWLHLSLILIAGLLFTSDLYTTWQYHRALSISHGLSDHSDAIYELANWLATEADGPVIAMDWGMAATITYLTAGKVTPREVFGYNWSPATSFENFITPYLHNPQTFFLWRTPEEAIFDRSSDFKALYRPLNLEENIAAAFYEENGRPLLGVTHLVTRGAAENKPQEIDD